MACDVTYIWPGTQWPYLVLVIDLYDYENRLQAEHDILSYIQHYNFKRGHSYNNYLSPYNNYLSPIVAEAVIQAKVA